MNKSLLKNRTKNIGVRFLAAFIAFMLIAIAVITALPSITFATSLTASKRAYFKVDPGDLSWSGGGIDPLTGKTKYQEVNVGAIFNYRIDVGVTDPLVSVKYDIVFALDWSGSMTNNFLFKGFNARLYGKDLALNLSQYIFDKYPESRVSLLAMTVKGEDSNTDDISKVYIEKETPFVGIDGYNSAIANVFSNDEMPIYSQSDISAFMRTATNKLEKREGGSDHIPVIIMISDFQSKIDSKVVSGNDPEPAKWDEAYWQTSVNAAADNFYSSMPDGIFLSIFTEHSEYTFYDSDITRGFINDHILSKSTKWGMIRLCFINNASHYNPNWGVLVDHPSIASELKQKFVGIVVPPINAMIKDVLPEGLRFLSGKPYPSSVTINEFGRYEVVWSLAEIAKGNCTVEITVQAVSDKEFVNYATFHYGDLKVDTNNTYHKAILNTQIDFQKFARSSENRNDFVKGSAEAPIAVTAAQEIEYVLRAENKVNSPFIDRVYDVLFVLNLSDSMDSQMGSKADSKSALSYGKDLVNSMSNYIYENYEGSRVGVLGMSAPVSNANAPQNVSVDFDSFTASNELFHKKATYETYIGSKLASIKGSKSGHDEAAYLTKAHQTLTMYPNSWNIPIVILISDYQMQDPNYWENDFKVAAKLFTSADYAGRGSAILPVRLDSLSNSIGYFDTLQYSDYMTAITNLQSHWNWLRVPYEMAFNDALDSFIEMFASSVPLPYKTVIIDRLPKGMKVVKVDDGMSYYTDQNGFDVIKVETKRLPSIPTYYEFTAKIVDASPGIFINEATLTYGTTEIISNKTYHSLLNSLFIRALAVSSKPEELIVPAKAYLTLSQQINSLPLEANLVAPFGAYGVGETMFAQYKVAPAMTHPSLSPSTPQGYKYLGYVLTQTSAGHDPANMVTGKPVLDFTQIKGCYVTFFFEPIDGIEEANVDTVVNDIGTFRITR